MEFVGGPLDVPVLPRSPDAGVAGAFPFPFGLGPDALRGEVGGTRIETEGVESDSVVVLFGPGPRGFGFLAGPVGVGLVDGSPPRSRVPLGAFGGP